MRRNEYKRERKQMTNDDDDDEDYDDGDDNDNNNDNDHYHLLEDGQKDSSQKSSEGITHPRHEGQ